MSSSKYAKTSSASTRSITFFVPGAGIEREVISTDICRYLGNDATSRPGSYTNSETGEIISGYFVTAYRALTTEQIADIKSDSIRWNNEKRLSQSSGRGASYAAFSPHAGVPSGGRPNPELDAYRQSATRKQQWSDQPETFPPPQRDSGRQAPPVTSSTQAHKSSSSASKQSLQSTSQYESQYAGQQNNNWKIAAPYEVKAAQPAMARADPRYPNSAGFTSGADSYSNAAPVYPANTGVPVSGQSRYASYPQGMQPPVYTYEPSSSTSNVPRGYTQPRESSPKHVLYVGNTGQSKDVEMYDYVEDEYEESASKYRVTEREPEAQMSTSSSYRTPARESEPSRRNVREREEEHDRHRDSRNRRR